MERVTVEHHPAATDAERDAVEMVAACVQTFENGIGTDFRDRCNEFYRLYRGFKRFRHAWEAAGPNDRDVVLLDAKKTWGANLHIPLSFRTVETMVPRAIAHRPRMLYLPRHEMWEENVGSVRLLIDAQQENIDIDLRFQDVMRDGMVYGLGVGKTFWRKTFAPYRPLERRVLFPNRYKVGELQRKLVFDDPDFEAVDPFDFMWDPRGADLNHGSARALWIVHRVWMDPRTVRDRIESGAWNTPSAQALTPDDLRSMGNAQKRDEIWQDRMTASGFGSFAGTTSGEQVHEVWEYHDGFRVLTVLDRRVLVQDAENPCQGEIPFEVYRPTRIPHQMVGIGEIEPVQHLQRELDTLRSQRRDAATIALCAGYAYDDAAIDEDDLIFGPAAAIRVSNAVDVRQALMPLPTKDVPGSGYQEEQVIRADFDAVTGINDALDPAQGQISTATEAQLVQAALSRRIELKSRRFEVEVVRHAARCFLYLNQRMILQPREPLRQPDEGLDPLEAAREGRWQWVPIGPGELRGEFEIVPEGGSMAAENIPQNRQDAQIWMNLAQSNPYIDQRRALLRSLELLGAKQPESWLKPQEPPLSPLVLQLLQRAGVAPQLIEAAVQISRQQDPRLASPEQQGPNVQQTQQLMEGAPA